MRLSFLRTPNDCTPAPPVAAARSSARRILAALALLFPALDGARAQSAASPPPSEEPSLADALQPLPPERYQSLWQDSAFGIDQPEPEQTATAPANPLEGVRLVGVLNRGEDDPVVLIQRGEGNPVETLNYAQGQAGYDLIEVILGASVEETRVMLAGPDGEGWLTFETGGFGLPTNESQSVSAPGGLPQEQAENDDDDDDDDRDRRRGRGRWSEEERQQARERVQSELQRANEMLEQAQDPAERNNLQERIRRLEEFQRRISDDD